MRPKKLKKKKEYTIMWISNQASDVVKQCRMSAKQSRILVTLGVLFFVTILLAGSFSIARVVTGTGIAFNLQTEVTSLMEQNAQLTLQNKELTDKVTILSDTVNKKVEVEQAKAVEDQQNSEPSGYPLSGQASMTEANANEAAGEGAAKIPIVIFEASAGTSVIASGSGTVVSVVSDDAEYGNQIRIDHGNGYISVYRNASTPRVSNGDAVTRGTLLFDMQEDSTKLGYQIMNQEQYMDPLDLLDIAG
ncbi:MAG: M23 family metallopeptidase [Lachnospiraceae bacterium]